MSDMSPGFSRKRRKWKVLALLNIVLQAALVRQILSFRFGISLDLHRLEAAKKLKSTTSSDEDLLGRSKAADVKIVEKEVTPNNAEDEEYKQWVPEKDYDPDESLKLRYIGKIDVQRPAYLQLTEGESPDLWISQFSLTRGGSVTKLRMGELAKPRTGAAAAAAPTWGGVRAPFLWPNEVAPVPPGTVRGLREEALLVADGFLMPGKNDGAVYLVASPGGPGERRLRLTAPAPGFFYHKAVWVDLFQTGQKGILTARAKKPLLGQAEGELVFFEQPLVRDPLASFCTPWKETVITTGPDVMFEVIDIDPDDDSIEIVAAEFFNERLTLTSLAPRRDWLGPNKIQVKQKMVIDAGCGPAYGVTAANLRTGRPGDPPTHLLVTSHACQYDPASDFSVEEITCGSDRAGGGVLYAYEIPTANWQVGGAPAAEGWRGWERRALASGFRVHQDQPRGFNPGAPGFVYAFHPTRRAAREGKDPPYIAVAGDCAQAAYILAPAARHDKSDSGGGYSIQKAADYEMLCMISCGGTVGSLAFGFLDIHDDDDDDDEKGKSYSPPDFLGEATGGSRIIGHEFSANDEGNNPTNTVSSTVKGLQQFTTLQTVQKRTHTQQENFQGGSHPVKDNKTDNKKTDEEEEEFIKILMPNYDQDKIYIFEMTDKQQGRYHYKALRWREGVNVDTPW